MLPLSWILMDVFFPQFIFTFEMHMWLIHKKTFIKAVCCAIPLICLHQCFNYAVNVVYFLDTILIRRNVENFQSVKDLFALEFITT